MKYIFAYDGGGTKTRINVADLNGNILFDKTTTGSNILGVGKMKFREIIEGLFVEAKQSLKIKNEDIAQVFLGLSGADLEEDYFNLYEACNPIFTGVKFEILNDAWIIMRSGLSESYGAVCICGTGTNSAAINKDGNKAILRSLSFTLGTKGGGLDIARDALHYAFRADELSYKETILRTKIPDLLGVKKIEDIIPMFYPTRTLDSKRFGSITGLVGECAANGDEVSNMILKENAKHIALQTAGVIKQVHIEHEKVPVVIGGRVFSIKAPIFLDTFKETILEEVPRAEIVVPRFTPVIGAYLFALDNLNIKQSKEIEENLMNSGGKL